MLRVQGHLDVDPRDTVRLGDVDLPAARLLKSMLMDLLISVNDVLELYIATSSLRLAKHLDRLVTLIDLAHAINRAHDQLVEVSTEEQVRFKAECDEQDVPYELSALLANLEVLTHLLNGARRDLLDSSKEYLKLAQGLFLVYSPLVHLSESLRVCFSVRNGILRNIFVIIWVVYGRL